MNQFILFSGNENDFISFLNAHPIIHPFPIDLIKKMECVFYQVIGRAYVYLYKDENFELQVFTDEVEYDWTREDKKNERLPAFEM